MLSSNIYTVSGSVLANDGIYIHRNADDELIGLCRAGEFAYILTPRQSGKSSLMDRTVQQLDQENICGIVIDLQGHGVLAEPGQWYYGLLAKIEEQVDLKTDIKKWWREHESLPVAQRLILFFKEVLLTEAEPERRVVIFVDEIDNTLNLNFTDDFFAAIRYMYSARPREVEFRRLSFVLIGVATPSDLIRDPKRTPFNIGQRVELTDFTFEEALPLADGLGMPAEAARRVLRQALEWTGGQPCLTQRLCKAMADRGHDDWEDKDVDGVVAETFFGARSREDDHLLFVRDMLTKRAGKLREGVLTTYRDVLRGKHVTDDERSLIKSHLKLSGVVRREDGALRVRNPIYRNVFDEVFLKGHIQINWTRLAARAGATLVIVGVLVAAILAPYAWAKKREAEAAQRQLEIANAEIRESLKREQNARTLAEQRRAEAEAARSDLEVANQKISDSLKNEQTAKADAVTQRVLAERRRAEAEEQRQEAQRQRSLAEDQRLKAEKQKKVAEAQRQMAMARQAELQASRAMAEGNFPAAQALYAKALSLDDTLETKGRYLEAKTKSFLAPAWKSPVKYPGGKFALNSDGKKMATLAENNEIAISNISTGEVITKLKGHGDKVMALSFKPDGQHLISWSADGTIRIWDILTGREIHKFQYREAQSDSEESDSEDTDCCSTNARRLAQSRDGKRLAMSDDGVITVRDAETGRVIDTLLIPWPGLTSLNFSSEGDLAAGFLIGGAIVWKANDYKNIRLIEHGPPVTHVEFSAGGKLVSFGGTKIKIWDLSTSDVSKPVHIVSMGEVEDIACSREEEKLVAGMKDGTIKLIDVHDGKNILEFNSYLQKLDSVNYANGGVIMALGEEESILRWEMRKTSPTLLLQGQRDPVHDISFSRDTRMAATIHGDGQLRVWEISSTRIIRQLDLRSRLMRPVYGDNDLLYVPAVKVLFTPDDKSILVAGLGFQALVIDIATGTISDLSPRIPTTDGSTTFITDAAYSLNGQWMALSSSGDDEIFIRNLISPDKTIRALSGHERPVTGLSFSPDGKYLSSSSIDQTVRIWELSTGKNVRTFTNPWKFPFASVAYSHDGQLLASSSLDQKIRVWDVRTGEEVLNYETFDELPVSVNFSPDGAFLAWGSGTQSVVRVLNVSSWEELPPLRKDDGIVPKVLFSPDNNWLASAGESAAVRLWNMDVIRSVYSETGTSVLKEAEDETGLFVRGTDANQFSQLDLYTTLGRATESAFQIRPLEERNATKSASCKPLPIVATFNPFPLTFQQPAEFCKNYPALDLRLAGEGEYAPNRVVWERGIPARTGDVIYALVYIDNGVANNKPPEQAVARKVKVRTFIDSNVGAEHTVSVSFGGEYTNQVSKSLKVKTGPSDYLQVVPYSGALYDVKGRLIKQNLQIGNNTYFLEDLAPGFETDKFIRFAIKVKTK